MSLDVARLDAAIRRNDAAGVREALRDAAEPERMACARTLRQLLRGPGWPDPRPVVVMRPEALMAMIGSGELAQPSAERQLELAERRRRMSERRRRMSERQRQYEEWRAVARGLAFQLAVFGLAGSVAAAARAARDISGARDGTDAGIGLVAAVLADRAPGWLADFMDRHLRLWGKYPLGVPAWPLARELVRLGAIARPGVPEYTTLMPSIALRCPRNPDGTRGPAPTPAQALLADPGLLEDEVWRLFTVPDAALVLHQADRRADWMQAAGWWAPGQTWSEGLAQLCVQGHLDRDRLLDACLDAFTRDFVPNRVSWYAVLLRQPGVPGPARVQPGAGALLSPPVTDPDELVQLLTVLMEDACDAIAAERALAGAVRLSALPERQRRRAAAPLLRRAASVMDIYVPFSGARITSDMALIAHTWGGGRLPVEDVRREDRWHMPGGFAVSSSGRALTMAGIFSARAWEAARIIEAGQGGLLLAEPETTRGAISPQGMLERVRLARQVGRAAGRHDQDAALLRLAPGPADSLWPAWDQLAGTAAGAMRESHRLVRLPLSFEAVAGKPAGTPFRGHNEWHQHLLARTAGQVPAVPGCASWQLLTSLSDPVGDHAVLYGPRRYNRHYDAAVAGWPLICPWQPELAAAHLLRPLSDGLKPRQSPATTAIVSLNDPGHPLGPVGHLALVTGLASAEADTRIAAAQLWSDACADGRLDPALAAAALVTGVSGQALKLNRVCDGLQHASHDPLAARRIVETACDSAAGLAAAAPAGLHLLIELAARLGATVGVPELPGMVKELASRRSTSRLGATARQLLQAHDSRAPGREPAPCRASRRQQAALKALAALVARAET